MQPRRGNLTQHLVLSLLLVCAIVLAGCQSATGVKTKNQSAKNGIFGLNKNSRTLSPVTRKDDALDPMGDRNGDRILLQDLSPGQIGTTFKVKGFAKPNQAEAEAAFQRGQSLYEQALGQLDSTSKTAGRSSAQFEQAANEFRLAADRWPDSALEQDALFYEGESYFFSNRYVQANRAFEKLIGHFSGTRYLDKAEARRFSIAQYWLELGRQAKSPIAKVKMGDPQRPTFNLASEARRILHRIRLDDPSGKLADDATMALANAYFEAKMYQDAADTYEDLRQTYPGSTHQFHAHLFELKSRMNSYYGKSYDQEPLVKADALLKKIVQQFPDQADSESEYLGTEATTIRTMLAERDFSLGEYYEKRGENLAAQIMYQEVAKNYSDTPLAAQGVQRVAALDGKQPAPTQHAQWLVDILPQSEASKPIIASGDKESIFR
jgi:outer membrane protein assembly factor BamD (BamD/ComL family)